MQQILETSESLLVPSKTAAMRDARQLPTRARWAVFGFALAPRPT